MLNPSLRTALLQIASHHSPVFQPPATKDPIQLPQHEAVLLRVLGWCALATAQTRRIAGISDSRSQTITVPLTKLLARFVEVVVVVVVAFYCRRVVFSLSFFRFYSFFDTSASIPPLRRLRPPPERDWISLRRRRSGTPARPASHERPPARVFVSGR